MSKEQMKSIVASHPHGLITIEEHQKSCGMSSAVVEIVNDLYSEGTIDVYPKIRRIAIPDEFADVVGSQKYMRELESIKLI